MRRLGGILALLALLWPTGAALAEQCAKPVANGTASPGGVVNTYYPGTASANVGATTISLGAGAGAATPIAAGDMLLVIQMQGATINSTNSTVYGDGTASTFANGITAIGQTGLYEFVRAASAVGIGGGSVTIVGGSGAGLINAYATATATSSAGQRRFQVVRVPQYANARLTGAVTALPWNGTAGGILSIDVADRLTFAGGSLNASAAGFRGGGGRQVSGNAQAVATDYRALATANAHGAKGEGIAGTPTYVNNAGTLVNTNVEGYPSGSQGRGAPGNAGGGGTDGNPTANDQNSGGGGGGNAGAGGKGGHARCSSYATSCATTGGHPGATAPNAAARLMMGGGGGAGTNNDGTGSPGAGLASSGAAGGGIVIIRAGEVAGSGTIMANGAAGNMTGSNDASGGGGAGGTVLVSALRNSGGGSISAEAKGGAGGSNTGGGSPHGPGGGGGGGFVASNNVVALSASTSGGAAGTTASGGFPGGTNYGASAGAAGATAAIAPNAIVGVSSGAECTPTITKSFGTSPVTPGAPSVMSVVVTNNNPDLALTAAAFNDAYPAGLVNAATPAAAKNCTVGTLAAAAGGSSLALSSGTVPAAGSCTYSVTTTVSGAGDKTNVIAAGGLTGSYGSVSVASLEAASAIIQVAAPLTIVKSSQIHMDPVNGTANAKAIPGAYVYYSIVVANPSGVAVTSNSIAVIDATPANMQLYVADLPGTTGPISFQDGGSGLVYTFGGLASLTDSVDFSNNAGSSWTYVPTPDGSGVDPAVTHLRLKPAGAMAAGTSATISVRYLIR